MRATNFCVHATEARERSMTSSESVKCAQEGCTARFLRGKMIGGCGECTGALGDLERARQHLVTLNRFLKPSTAAYINPQIEETKNKIAELEVICQLYGIPIE